MRILQLVSAFAYSGPAAATVSLAVQQHALGHDVTLGHDTVRPDGNIHEEGMGPRAAATGLPLASELALCTQSGLLIWLRDRARLKARFPSVDVVHTHFSHDHTLAAMARGRSRKPLLVRTVHSERSLHARVGQAWLLASADSLLVHAERTADDGARALGIPRQRFHVIRGPVELDTFHARDRDARRAAFRRKHGLTDAPMVLMAAIFQRGRGHAEVLREWAGVSERVPGAQLCFAGLGELRDGVMAQARGIPGVHFLGYLKEDLADAYAAADVSVLWAIGNDGYGRALLESMACGTPGVVADLPPVQEVVDAHGVGAVYRREEPGALSNALVEVLLQAPSMRNAWATQARKAMEEHHAPLHITQQTLAVYERLLAT